MKGRNPSVGTLASAGDIKIRITAKADHPEEASRLIQEVEREITDRLGVVIYGVEQETLQGNTIKELQKLGLTLSVVETLSGGIITQKLASTGSVFFTQGLVLPSEGSQKQFLNLSEEEFILFQKDPRSLTDTFARKSREEFKTDLAIAMFGRIPEEGAKDDF